VSHKTDLTRTVPSAASQFSQTKLKKNVAGQDGMFINRS